MSERHSAILNVRPDVYVALKAYREQYFPEASLGAVASYLLAVELELANVATLHMVNKTLEGVKNR